MRNKQKTKRLKEFKIHNFIGCFLSDIMAVKGVCSHFACLYSNKRSFIFYLDSFSMPHTNWEVSMERQFSFWVSNIWAFALVILLTVAVVGVLCNHKWTETQDTCWNELIVACTSLCTLVTVFFLCVCVCVTINGLKLRTRAEMSWLMHAAVRARLLQLQ